MSFVGVAMPWRGEVGGLGVQVQAQAAAAYWFQQHSPLSSSYGGANAESWSGFDQARISSSSGEMSMRGSDIDAADMGTSAFPLSDYQPETWWPPINVQINHNQQSIPNVQDRKPVDTIQPNSYSNSEFSIPDTPVPRLEAWCPEPAAAAAPPTSAIAELQASAPSSALAAVNTAIAEVTAAAAATGDSAPRGSRARRKSGKSASAPASPTKDGSLAVQKVASKRPLTQRQNHIWSERQRRKGMNHLFESLRSLLPQPSPTNKTDKSTVVGEIIKYIQTLQVQLEVLTKKQQQMRANPVAVVPIAVPVSRGSFGDSGVTVVDHSGEAGSATAVSVVPPAGRESCLQSYVGANVGVHVCGRNVFITTSSPRGRCGLLHQLLLTLHLHALDVINATISSTNASIFHCLHCQASQDAELVNNDLHHALQSVINQFG